MKKLIIYLFLMLPFLSFSEVILESSNTKPAINEPFNIRVIFLNEDKKDYNIEGVENLQILSKSTSSKTSIINGKKTQEKMDIYTVMSNDIKSFPLKVSVSGGKAESNSLNIEVQKEVQESINGDMSFQPSIKSGDSFYFGQKIVYEENFLTTVSINSIGYSKQPQFNDFSEKDMSPIALNGNYEQSYFRSSSGREGLKINTYRGILQANSSGEKKISSGQVAVTQSTGRRDFFFEESTPPKYFGGKQLNINILPLPQNKPTNFQNIVGEPTLDYTWSSDNVDVGDSILLTVKISGDANLDSLEKIIPKEFRDFNVFESLKNKSETINNGNYYAEKTFEVALIPKQAGEIDTPEIKIPYFDTTAKAYKYLTIPSKKIKVNKNGNIIPSNSEKNFTSPTPTNNQVENKIEDVVINSVGNEKVSQHKDYNYLIIGLIAVIIIQGATIIYLLFRKNGNSSSENLSNLAKCKDDREFYNAYCDFMKSRYNFSPKVHLEDRLVKLGFSPDFIEINRELEQAYYNNTPIDRKEILKRIKRELKNEK